MIVLWDTGVTFAMSDAMLRAQITPVIDFLVRVSGAVSQVNMANSVTYPVISTAPMVHVSKTQELVLAAVRLVSTV